MLSFFYWDVFTMNPDLYLRICAKKSKRQSQMPQGFAINLQSPSGWRMNGFEPTLSTFSITSMNKKLHIIINQIFHFQTFN